MGVVKAPNLLAVVVAAICCVTLLQGCKKMKRQRCECSSRCIEVATHFAEKVASYEHEPRCKETCEAPKKGDDSYEIKCTPSCSYNATLGQCGGESERVPFRMVWYPLDPFYICGGVFMCCMTWYLTTRQLSRMHSRGNVRMVNNVLHG